MLKKIIKRFLRKNKPGLNNLDEKLSKYLSFKDGFFIEAGANDGYKQSNTYYLERKLGWKGVLIEGIPELYEVCKKIRPNSSVFNYALVSDSLRTPTVKMHYADLMSVVEGSLKDRNLEAEHINKGLKVQKLDSSYSLDVQTITLTELLDQMGNITKINFLSLDVEGYEAEVLKGLDFDKYYPDFILVEARFFNEVDSILNKKYKLADKLTLHDYLYISKVLGNY